MEELYTKQQLSKQLGHNQATIAKVLKNVVADGKIVRWPAYTIKTWEKAWEDYRRNATEDIQNVDTDASGDIKTAMGEASLRWKIAQAESMELDNNERKRLLVPRTKVDRYFQFLTRLFVSKVKQLCKDYGDDYYNITVEELQKDILGYINEENISDIVDDESLKKVEEIIERVSSSTYDI